MLSMAFAVLGFVAILVGPQVSRSDDGGVVGIAVKDLQFSGVKFDDKNGVVKTPITFDATTGMTTDGTLSYEVGAVGGEAAKLMRILPPSFSVLTTEYPSLAKVYNANFRALEITDKTGKISAAINCEGGELVFAPSVNGESTEATAKPRPPKFKPFVDGAHCTIAVGPRVEDDNISYNFDPKKAICSQ